MMLKPSFHILCCLGLLASCKSPKSNEELVQQAPDTPTVKTHKLVQKWETDTILKVPESVLYDAKNKVLYVANMDGEAWAKDGKGSIAKVGLDGTIIQAEWVKGLHAPKGMGLWNDRLFVADITQIAVINISSGVIEGSIRVAGSKGLNDLSLDASGVIYVTDSEGKRLYRVENNSATIVLDSLEGPNGVLVRGADLFILNAGAMYKVNKNKSLSIITDGLEGGADGIENVKEDDFILSCWTGTLWYLNGDGRKEMVYDGKSLGKNTADIGLDPVSKMVYVPTFFKNSVIAFEIVEE